MGILNVTPDSFSDGGQFLHPDDAIRRALQMEEEGADIIDIGGESTRPGSRPVPAEEESRRVIPVVREVSRRCSCLVSIDTVKASVAEAALEAGAHIVNDVSALADEEMGGVIHDSGAGLVLMHMQGNPRTMQADPRYCDVAGEVRGFLEERIRRAAGFGIARERVAVDPGIGFGKTVEHNLELLRSLPALGDLGCPVLVGLSRKSFLGKLLGREAGDRLAGSLAASAFALMQGAHILRVHDVKESCDTARLVDILQTRKTRHGSTARSASA